MRRYELGGGIERGFDAILSKRDFKRRGETEVMVFVWISERMQDRERKCVRACENFCESVF